MNLDSSSRRSAAASTDWLVRFSWSSLKVRTMTGRSSRLVTLTPADTPAQSAASRCVAPSSRLFNNPNSWLVTYSRAWDAPRCRMCWGLGRRLARLLEETLCLFFGPSSAMFFPPVPADLHLKQNAFVFIHGEHPFSLCD